MRPGFSSVRLTASARFDEPRRVGARDHFVTTGGATAPESPDSAAIL